MAMRTLHKRLASYGLGYDEWARRLTTQLGRCGICRTYEVEPMDLLIDHDCRFAEDERLGFRGLLCTKCHRRLRLCHDKPMDFPRYAVGGYTREWMQFMAFGEDYIAGHDRSLRAHCASLIEKGEFGRVEIIARALKGEA